MAMRLAAGTTVLVTGASCGIGFALAHELARRGCHLILVARDSGRLEALAADLRERFGVQVEWRSTDLSAASGVAELVAFTRDRGLTVDVLINNAAMGVYGQFAESTLSSAVDQIQVNVQSLVALTHGYLPEMLQRGSGGIIQVASVVGYGPLPRMAMYAATKAFVIAFAEGLWSECRGTGVHVMLFNPGGTRTEFHQRAGVMKTRPKLGFDSAEDVARAMIRAFERGRRSATPGFKAWITVMATRLAPRGLFLWVLDKVMRRRR